MPSSARVAISLRTAMLGRIGSIPSIRGDPHLSVLFSLVRKSCIRSSSSELILLVRSGFLRRRDLLELESAESSFEVRLWLGEGTEPDAGTGAVAEAAAAGDVDGARSGGLSVLGVPAASGVVTSGFDDGTFAEINGNDLAAHGSGTGWPPPSKGAVAAVMVEGDAGGLRLRVGLWPGGTGVCREEFRFGDIETGLFCIACSRISFTKSDVSTPPGILSLPFLPTSLLSCFASLMCNPPKSLPPGGNGGPIPSGTIGGMLCNP